MNEYIRVNQIKLAIDDNEDKIYKKISSILKVSEKNITELIILKKSIDARDKNDIRYSYSVAVKLDVVPKKSVYGRDVSEYVMEKYEVPKKGTLELAERPVIVGCGPAGLFCGLLLAKNGYRPIIIDRGYDVDNRQKDIDEFFNTGVLNPNSNVQFGEGGAGTFSDGKLNTTIKDVNGRNHYVLETFASYGADPSITYVNKPHIGTDVLKDVVKNMRKEIISNGGEVRFGAKLTDIYVANSHIEGIEINNSERIDTSVLVLALGHSARDTFEMIYSKNIAMQAKPYAVGVRVSHKQKMINKAMYGDKYADILPAADYKLTYNTKDKRGVFSFCMCPGGYVVNASSEKKRLAINGMSYSKRDSENANSAIIVSITPDDYQRDKNNISPLDGIYFQRNLEEKAYICAGGKIPTQKYGDYVNNKVSSEYGSVKPVTKGECGFGNIRDIFPDYINDSIIEAMPSYGRTIKGYDDADTLLMGVESRTSSPVRIVRNDMYESVTYNGLYPCGEGAGYAGGITSAAIDGMKVAEAIIAKYSIS